MPWLNYAIAAPIARVNHFADVMAVAAAGGNTGPSVNSLPVQDADYVFTRALCDALVMPPLPANLANGIGPANKLNSVINPQTNGINYQLTPTMLLNQYMMILNQIGSASTQKP